jgi:hypothetical protein
VRHERVLFLLMRHNKGFHFAEIVKRERWMVNCDKMGTILLFQCPLFDFKTIWRGDHLDFERRKWFCLGSFIN